MDIQTDIEDAAYLGRTEQPRDAVGRKPDALVVSNKDLGPVMARVASVLGHVLLCLADKKDAERVGKAA